MAEQSHSVHGPVPFVASNDPSPRIGLPKFPVPNWRQAYNTWTSEGLNHKVLRNTHASPEEGLSEASYTESSEDRNEY